MADRASAVLRAFAELSPAGERATFDVAARGHPLVWLGLRTSLVEQVAVAGAAGGGFVVGGGRVLRRDARVQRLAALDALHEHERLLREGWVYVVGSALVEGEVRRLCHPLLSRPVTLSRTVGGFATMPVGDLELTPLVTDPQAAGDLERDAQFGGGALSNGSAPHPRLLPRLTELLSWVDAVATAAGLKLAAVLDWTADVDDLRGHDDLVAVVGAGLHLVRDVAQPGMGDILRSWAQVPGIGRTAFGALYGQGDTITAPVDEPVRSSLPLTPAQRAVVLRSRYDPVVAVSGAPGNGKSHVVAAVALDVVARGGSVLVATPSRYAADVIGQLLHRHPGPDPVLFGSTARRQQVAADLADGVTAADAATGRDVQTRRTTAWQHVDELHAAIVARLAREQDAARAATWEPLFEGLRDAAPGVFAPGADLAAIADLLAAARSGARAGPFGRLRVRLSRRRLRAMVGGTADADADELGRALDAARCRRAAMDLATDGGTVIGPLWSELFAADAVAADAEGRFQREVAREARGADRSRTRAVGALATALRAGRAARRQQLRQIDPAALTAALPLWIGSLVDVDDLLPPVPRLFDVVILDEASQIDQPRAAPALLRARRAVVVGDPRQLRHVSFVGDAQQQRALDEAGLRDTDQLDVRRASVFDAAAAVVTITFLSEHHRSVPHLIEFAARRFYGDRVGVCTRHPRVDEVDAVKLVAVTPVTNDDAPDGGTDDRVDRGEVAAVAAQLDELAQQGATSVGVLSPFRGQADALEAMLLERFGLDGITRLGLRVGTVHAFQGAERDVMVVSLALRDADSGQRRRFVEDPNLCNVMITRARERMIIVTSLRDPGTGLLADYLRYAGHPLPAAPAVDVDAAWPTALAEELRRNDVTVRTGYRVGGDVLDLVVGEGGDACAVDCRVDPGGPAAHVARRRALHRADWQVREAYASRYDDNPVRAVLDVFGDDLRSR